MQQPTSDTFPAILGLLLSMAPACRADDASPGAGETSVGHDGDSTGDDDGDSTGDGDGEPPGDGDGDGDPPGDGDGDDDPPAPTCGDGNIDLGEECDDGNPTNSDACTNACTNAACGDGIIQDGVEECDDGNDDDTDTCIAGCLNSSCGDGYVGPGEGCDDGNNDDGDTCSNDCALASCGDGIVQNGEACDDGDFDNNDGCLDTCVAANCGDGYTWNGQEQCDDGNADNSDNCLNSCNTASCGDGYTWSGQEQCDDGDNDESDGCLTTCIVPGSCVDILLEVAPVSGSYAIDPDGPGGAAGFDVYCDMNVAGGGWTSLVHHTQLAQLNFSLDHNEVALSEGTKFWILNDKPGVNYTVETWANKGSTLLRAESVNPADTGWRWNGFNYPNPPCHGRQELILVQSPDIFFRSSGNPHFNQGCSNPPGLGGAAFYTASTIDVAPVANYPAMHIGCVGYNVLEDPIVWIR